MVDIQGVGGVGLICKVASQEVGLGIGIQELRVRIEWNGDSRGQRIKEDQSMEVHVAGPLGGLQPGKQLIGSPFFRRGDFELKVVFVQGILFVKLNKK